ncbi:MAG: hypothetical protein JNL67_05920 [Planctomycetaceae bacterium]|nr:hypothetical protein [Planctomycetaceae bacterium]
MNRQGLNMVEVAISSLIVGVMLVASLRVVGQSFLTQRMNADLATAQFLAEGILSEALQLSYMEPGLTTSGIARETGELAANRTNYDDVDDYHNYNESPPKSKDNVVLTGFTGWQRTVTVHWVNHANLTQTSGTDTGFKRVTVVVRRNGTLITTARGFRGNAP